MYEAGEAGRLLGLSSSTRSIFHFAFSPQRSIFFMQLSLLIMGNQLAFTPRPEKQDLLADAQLGRYYSVGLKNYRLLRHEVILVSLLDCCPAKLITAVCLKVSVSLLLPWRLVANGLLLGCTLQE